MPYKLHLRFNNPGDGNGKIDKVKAIKAVRRLTGYGLKEAKEFVEQAMDLDSGREVLVTVLYADGDGRFPEGAERREQFLDLEVAGFHGYIQDVNDSSRRELVDGMKQTLINAINHGQYDIAQDLLNLVEKYDH